VCRHQAPLRLRSCKRQTPAEGAVPRGAGTAAQGPRSTECAERGPRSPNPTLVGRAFPRGRVRVKKARARPPTRPLVPGAPPGTYHLGDLEAAERAAQVVRVAAQAGQPAALAHRLGGGLVRAAGARDHGGARGLALEAVQLLAAPHAAAPRGRFPRRLERAGSERPPHRRRQTTPPPPPLRPPPAAAAARSAGARLPPPRQRKGREAGAGAEGRRREPRAGPEGAETAAGAGRGGALRAGGGGSWGRGGALQVGAGPVRSLSHAPTTPSPAGRLAQTPGWSPAALARKGPDQKREKGWREWRLTKESQSCFLCPQP
jgi:hypothetical protein